jgi:hypothetical protein
VQISAIRIKNKNAYNGKLRILIRMKENNYMDYIRGVPEMHGKILTTSFWLHVEIGKNI